MTIKTFLSSRTLRLSLRINSVRNLDKLNTTQPLDPRAAIPLRCSARGGSMKRRKQLWNVMNFIIAALVLVWHPANAQEKIKISYSSIDAPNANWYIAEYKRIYQKYGLDTDLVFISSSTTNVAAVVAGSVKVGNISGGALANAAVGGADLVCVGSFINTLPYDLVVSELIKSPQGLKGKSVGISRVGSSSDVAARV